MVHIFQSTDQCMILSIQALEISFLKAKNKENFLLALLVKDITEFMETSFVLEHVTRSHLKKEIN
jgi:hypothetical protein